MKLQIDLKGYATVLVGDAYTIYEHPKTFHYVMTYDTRRGDRTERSIVAQWNMPGLAQDEWVLVPPGFVQMVIKQMGKGGAAGKNRQAADRNEGRVGQMDAGAFYVDDGLNFRNAVVADVPRFRWERIVDELVVQANAPEPPEPAEDPGF